MYNIILRAFVVSHKEPAPRFEFQSRVGCASELGLDTHATESSIHKVFKELPWNAWRGAFITYDDRGLLSWAAAILHPELRTSVSLVTHKVDMDASWRTCSSMRKITNARVPNKVAVISLYCNPMNVAQYPGASTIFVPHKQAADVCMRVYRAARKTASVYALVTYCKQVANEVESVRRNPSSVVKELKVLHMVLMPCATIVPVYVILFRRPRLEATSVRALMERLSLMNSGTGDHSNDEFNQSSMKVWRRSYSTHSAYLAENFFGYASTTSSSSSIRSLGASGLHISSPRGRRRSVSLRAPVRMQGAAAPVSTPAASQDAATPVVAHTPPANSYSNLIIPPAPPRDRTMTGSYRNIC